MPISKKLDGVAPTRHGATGPDNKTSNVCSDHDNISNVSVADQHCIVCLKKSGQLKRCAVCKSGKYCSKECQKADFKNHKVFCSAITSLEDVERGKYIDKNFTIFLRNFSFTDSSEQ